MRCTWNLVFTLVFLAEEASGVSDTASEYLTLLAEQSRHVPALSGAVLSLSQMLSQESWTAGSHAAMRDLKSQLEDEIGYLKTRFNGPTGSIQTAMDKAALDFKEKAEILVAAKRKAESNARDWVESVRVEKNARRSYDDASTWHASTVSYMESMKTLRLVRPQQEKTYHCDAGSTDVADYNRSVDNFLSQVDTLVGQQVLAHQQRLTNISTALGWKNTNYSSWFKSRNTTRHAYNKMVSSRCAFGSKYVDKCDEQSEFIQMRDVTAPGQVAAETANFEMFKKVICVADQLLQNSTDSLEETCINVAYNFADEVGTLNTHEKTFSDFVNTENTSCEEDLFTFADQGWVYPQDLSEVTTSQNYQVADADKHILNLQSSSVFDSCEPCSSGWVGDLFAFEEYESLMMQDQNSYKTASNITLENMHADMALMKWGDIKGYKMISTGKVNGSFTITSHGYGTVTLDLWCYSYMKCSFWVNGLIAQKTPPTCQGAAGGNIGETLVLHNGDTLTVKADLCPELSDNWDTWGLQFWFMWIQQIDYNCSDAAYDALHVNTVTLAPIEVNTEVSDEVQAPMFMFR